MNKELNADRSVLFGMGSRVAEGEKVKEGRYPNFDLLRLLLALEVVFAHTWGWGPLTRGPIYIISPVAAFVSISGFLVLRSIEGSGGYGRFIWKRICRVVPLFTVALVLGLVLLGGEYFRQSLYAYGTVGLQMKGDGAMWSLSAEEILYGLMAILFALGAYRTGKVAGMAIILSLPLAALLVFPPLLNLAGLAPSFFAGSLCYIKRDQLSRLPRWVWFALAAAAMLWTPHTAALWHSLRILTGSVAVVGIGAWGPRLQPVHMPDFSYGIYVLHEIFLAEAARLGYAQAWGLMIAFPVAVASWYLIESPALRLKAWKPRLVRSNDLPVGAVALGLHTGVEARFGSESVTRHAFEVAACGND